MLKKQSREELDVDVRFLLANERTLLAWIRTGLAVMAAGVAVAFLSTNDKYLNFAGLGAVLLGGLLAVVGYVRYMIADKAIRAGHLPPVGRSEVFVVCGVVVFAFVLTVAKISGIH